MTTPDLPRAVLAFFEREQDDPGDKQDDEELIKEFFLQVLQREKDLNLNVSEPPKSDIAYYFHVRRGPSPELMETAKKAIWPLLYHWAKTTQEAGS